MLTASEIRIIAPRDRWAEIREDPRFLELLRVARVANSLSLAHDALIGLGSDQSPEGRRREFAGLFYIAALLDEGIHTGQSLGQWWRELPQYRDGFQALANDPALARLRAGPWTKVRDKVVFHFDRDVMDIGVSRIPTDDIVIASYPESGPTFGDTYFDVADRAVMGFLFGSAYSDEEYECAVRQFVDDTHAVFSAFTSATHRLVAAGLLALGCKKQRVGRAV